MPQVWSSVLTQLVTNDIMKTMTKWYPTKKLVEALIENDIVTGKTAGRRAYQWITKAEKNGAIKPFKVTTTTGRQLRRFRDKDIKQIIKTFSVGGSGNWTPEPLE